MRGSAVIALLVLVVVLGCGQAASPEPIAPEPVGITRLCGPAFAADGASCSVSIDAAVKAVGPGVAVTAGWFETGPLCPPNARCLLRPRGMGHVLLRLADGNVVSVSVTWVDGKVHVGDATRPAFDAWPIPVVAELGLERRDIGSVPREVANRRALPICGVEDPRSNPVARHCFLNSVIAGKPAELVSGRTEPDGARSIAIYRFEGYGPVRVYSNSFLLPFSRAWTRNECSFEATGDERVIFLALECATTEIP
jgi:hypothetical protein